MATACGAAGLRALVGYSAPETLKLQRIHGHCLRGSGGDPLPEAVLCEVIGEPIERLAQLIGEPIKLTGKRALRKALPLQHSLAGTLA